MIFPKSFTTPEQSYSSFSAIEYAAIHTGQPCSGTAWLDEMIRAQRRERLAGQVLAGFCADSKLVVKDGFKTFALDACEAADALIAALEGGEE